MATIGTVTTNAQLAIGDSGGGIWPVTTVRAWVWEALQDYSVYFHRTQYATLNCSADDHDYDLPADFQEALLVEYPAGEDPPEYLIRMSRKRPEFWQSDTYYDVERTDQASAGDYAVLHVSASPAAGETITVTYRAHFYAIVTGGSDDLVYVPDTHLPILTNYVVWRAANERYAYESQQADATSVILEQLSHSAQRARDIYLDSIDRATRQTSRSHHTQPWRTDLNDPVY